MLLRLLSLHCRVSEKTIIQKKKKEKEKNALLYMNQDGIVINFFIIKE